MKLADAVKSRAPRDDTGFWEITHVQPGRGMSSVTHAFHDVGSSRVYQLYYTPGPFDVMAFGPDSREATPRSTYSVWTGLAFSQPDEYPVVTKWDDPEDWPDEKIRQVIEASVGPIPKSASIDIWSPDGEGAIYLEFKDLDVEDALAFAARMDEINQAEAENTPQEMESQR